jgi:epoxide hydrolase 4
MRANIALLAPVFAATILSAQEPAMQHHYATVNGIKLHYAQAGRGKLILFLHGFPEFWYAWKDQLAEFGKDHLAVAPDQRGYNLSDKPEGVDAYAASNLVADIRALAAHLNGGKPFVLVGHDWGGAIAWTFAMRHPELVERLVIINAPHPGVFDRELAHNPAQQQASQYMLLFRSPGAEQTLSANNYGALVNGVLGELKQSGKVTEADLAAYREAWSQPGALTGGLNWYRASRVGPPVDGQRESLVAAVGAGTLKVTVPTLVIWGEKDSALLTGNLVGLEEYVPRLTIKRIPDGSHWVVHEHPQLVNRLIREFLQTP